MDSKLLILLRFVVLCSWVHVGFSSDLMSQGDGGSGSGDATSCIKSLMPCKPFLKSGTAPRYCCVPLREILSKDIACFCNVFHNPEILKSFNVTLDEALKFPRACGANADISKCKTASSPTPSSGPPSSNNSSGSPPSNRAAVPQIAKFGLISFVVALCFSSL
ncbi:hypothetical protein Patl1_19580 [Pistacia atlantica]|uniref:Uncharacterized protein n=1 Tax=Pistacia atlantica TaxID=434234 RepID=A0ACC1C213_9ROSI|nr:hypothetical protein Patl1_19580 [Pistacia atlantica]